MVAPRISVILIGYSARWDVSIAIIVAHHFLLLQLAGV
jgi:hypothetical protein